MVGLVEALIVAVDVGFARIVPGDKKRSIPLPKQIQLATRWKRSAMPCGMRNYVSVEGILRRERCSCEGYSRGADRDVGGRRTHSEYAIRRLRQLITLMVVLIFRPTQAIAVSSGDGQKTTRLRSRSGRLQTARSRSSRVPKHRPSYDSIWKTFA